VRRSEDECVDQARSSGVGRCHAGLKRFLQFAGMTTDNTAMTSSLRVVLAIAGLLGTVTVAGLVLQRDEPSVALLTAPAPTTTIEATTSTTPATTTSAPAPRPTTTTTIRPAPTTTKAPATTTSVRPTTTRPAPAAGNAATDALALLNRDRTSRGLPALPVRADAQAKAQAWAEKVARDGALSHSIMSEGLTQCWTAVGENVAKAPSVAHAEQILMDDPPHRANILASRWTAVGVGVARSAGGYVVVHVFVTGC
jgi:uncharacterized protein YkwD